MRGRNLLTLREREWRAVRGREIGLILRSLLETVPAVELEAEPLDPYSHGLLLSEPPADRRVHELASIAGSVPAPDLVAGCCPFAPRCQWTAPDCEQAAPPLAEVTPGRLSACIRLPNIRRQMTSLREQAGRDLADAMPSRLPPRGPAFAAPSPPALPPAPWPRLRARARRSLVFPVENGVSTGLAIIFSL